MWFKNLQIYTLPKNWGMTAETLESLLEKQKFTPCASMDMTTLGWAPPRENGPLVHVVNKQMLMRLASEKKLLPGSVINQFTKVKAQEIEEQQGFKPGRKQLREIKENVTDELLPRAFPLQSSTWVWIDPVNGWLVVDSGSTTKADDVLKLLLKAIPDFPVEGLRPKLSPLLCMTTWLSEDEAPFGFTIDQDTELVSNNEGKSKIKYVKQSIEAEDVKKHIASGKQCTQLAMTWADKISFSLTASMIVKRIVPLDILNENESAITANDEERFDGNLMLMTGELNKLIADIIESLGGHIGKEDKI